MELFESWKTSQAWLSEELVQERDIVLEGMNLIDHGIRGFDLVLKQGTGVDHLQFGKFCGSIATKSRVLIHGCLCLMLNALGQESGALLRPLVEAIEMLEYVSRDPNRIEIVLSENRPSAGKIAKTIEGKFKDLRDYLNTHASHLGISDYSLNHLLNEEAGQFRPNQTQSKSTLRNNLNLLTAFQLFAVAEMAQCLTVAGANTDEYFSRINSWRGRTLKVFDRPKDFPDV